MIALAVLGVLLAGAVADAPPAPADTALRIPGTTLRLGITDAAALARGFAASVEGKRQGKVRFFGLPGAATLEFADGRLARVVFTVDDASPYEIEYVQDQLTAMGYRRRCARLVPGSLRCDWLGPVALHLEVEQARLTATAERPSAPAPAPPAARDTSRAPAAADTARLAEPAPMLPETLAVAIPGRSSSYAAAEVRHEGRCAYPPAAHRAGIQGRVWVLATVDTSGAVTGAAIARGIPELNEAALCAARLWAFAPRTWQGRPCRYRVLVPIAFTLH